MKFVQTGVALFAAAIFAAGCSSSGRSKAYGADGGGLGGSDPGIAKHDDGLGRNDSAAGAGTRYGRASPDDSSGPLAKRIIYFVYDSSEVQPEYLTVINNHADFLVTNKVKSVVLEGHADERGSPEYNIALGEQRAQSVAKLMKLQGVADSQIQIVSFGEEKPAVTGHDENAWQQNRRVEITYPER
jgi:peptidoglycan-associated lipoprotein